MNHQASNNNRSYSVCLWQVGAIVASLCLAAATPASGQNLLSLGGFEATAGGGEIPGWMLEESITGSPDPINSGSQVGFGVANHDDDPDGSGLWLRAFNGGDADRNFMGINAILSQTVAATPGETYTFVGWSNFEQNYSGGVDFLDGLSPIGQENGGSPVASPTQSFFDLEFLDAGGSVLQTETVDLVNDDFQFSGGGWLDHTVMGVAPPNTTEVRVVAKALDMVENINPGQSGFYDDFSLATATAPATNLLENGNLNTTPPSVEDLLEEVYEFIETPDTANSIATAGFANDPATGGSNGIWIRPFVADATSAEVRQVVDAMAGTEYTFDASARWEMNYLGDDASGANETLMQLAFLDDMGEIIDSLMLDLRDDGKTADGAWSTHSLSGTAPEGTVEVAVSAIVNNLTDNELMGGNQSAFWDDFSLVALTDGLDGDFNDDGVVDAIDYALWRENLGAADESALNGNGDGMNGVDTGDFNLWVGNYGAAAAGAVSSTPEPTALGLVVMVMLGASGRRRVR